MNLILIISLTIIIIIAIGLFAGYLADAAVNLKVSNDDKYEVDAKKSIDIATSIGWISVGLFIITFIVFIFGGIEIKQSDGIKSLEIFASVIFGIMAFVFVLIGILAASAAVNIKKGVHYTANKDQYTICMAIAISSLGGLGLVIIYYCVEYIKVDKTEKKNWVNSEYSKLI